MLEAFVVWGLAICASASYKNMLHYPYISCLLLLCIPYISYVFFLSKWYIIHVIPFRTC